MRKRISIDVELAEVQPIGYYLMGGQLPPEMAALLHKLSTAWGEQAGSQQPCPTCDGAGCIRCYGTGRQVLCKIDVAPTTTGRAVVQMWQGAPGTMQVVALTAPDRDLADVTVDAWLACLQNGGQVLDDRRAR